MSAAKAICDHMANWCNATDSKSWVSMAVWSNGNSYGIPDGIIYSFPCTCKDGKWEIVNGLEISDFSREKMDKTATELIEEKAEAWSALGL